MIFSSQVAFDATIEHARHFEDRGNNRDFQADSATQIDWTPASRTDTPASSNKADEAPVDSTKNIYRSTDNVSFSSSW
jgi:hypothetical protein